MIPRRRYERGNKGTEAPTSFLFFDTESDAHAIGPDGLSKDFTLRLWTACTVRREGRTFREPVWSRGRTADEFWNLVESASSWSRPLWAFAHNVAHDLTQLRFWDEFERRRWTAGPVERPPNPKTGKARRPWRGRLCLESRPTFLVLRGSQGLIKLVDTGNYWPTRLAAIGERLGLPKLEMPDPAADDEAWFTYCQRDTDVVRAAVCDLVAWWLKEDCGTFQMTAPMLARTEWRHTMKVRAKAGECTALVLETDSPSRTAEREAAYGGWVEPFYIGTHPGPLYLVDVNMLYPYVMREGLFPRARVRSPGACNLSDLRAWVEAYGVVAFVRLDTRRSGATYPSRDNGVQVHATGCFSTWLCGAELVRAVQSGHVTDVFDCHLFSVAPIFRDWSEKWMGRRLDAQEAGDSAQEEFCKLILTSLAGKFAQRGEVYQDAVDGPTRLGWGRTIDWDYDLKKPVFWRWFAGHTQKKVKGLEPLNAFPAIYGFVTAAAREFMKGVFAQMPEHSYLYTATDSIICTQTGLRALDRLELIHPTEPGRFKVEGLFAEAEIHGPNWYRLDNQWTIGGLHGRAELGPDGHWYAEVWQRVASMLERNPHGRCGFTRTRLADLAATPKNDAAGDGWRRPFRRTPDTDLSDRAPRRAHAFFRE